MAGALEGLRVVEAGSGIAGALATMVLSDQGADVIKVEPPGGDPMRAYGGTVVWHRGRRSAVVDLDEAEGRQRFKDLVATADILIESFPVGVMDSRGLGYGALHAEMPSLIYVSLTGYVRGTDAEH